MRKIDYIETWLDTIATSYSGSEKTRETYQLQFKAFLEFIGASAEQIVRDYDSMTEKAFRRKYAMLVRSWASELHKLGYSPSTISGSIRTAKSFFRCNDLPLGFVPNIKRRYIYHNRDIERKEIQQVIGVCRPRERAFYMMMAQTGLRPHTLCKLKLKDIEPDFSSGVIPCCVRVPAEVAKAKEKAHFTFMGSEAVKALKDYFAERKEMTEDSPIFSMYGKREGQFCDRQTFTNIFRMKLNALKSKELIDFERKEEGKPAELRLYNLRKFFRNNAGQAGVDYVNFWMGHTANYRASHIPASDVHYFSREDVEFHRKLYAEKAVPFLRLETATQTETERTIQELRKELDDYRQILFTMAKHWAYGKEEGAEEMNKLMDGLAKKYYPDWKTPEEKLKEKQKKA